MTCRQCGTRLNAGRCQGDDPLIRDRWGTAAQIAHRRGPDITAALIRRWAYRSRQPNDPLHGRITAKHVPGRGRGTTLYDDREMSLVERDTRVNAEQRGGQPRLARVELTPVA